ncbi:MAG: NADH:flavin oxidoreductase/NADH oxidase family protein [Nostoc sp. ChiSLP02]|nr:NADH:flavin oxidoreductase/NADH oxidase family protein [Nostoc sp. DedSLP05]MDZ8098645.1 NADH:flavin oxidoreductase/NADH oxidase family protein [Nostoc sp. DedSLP01]MDZ8183743.1 NADH:flavin oxidoreductase/NADH oxidase family protein [Nostoc sp. ChiSLP02]
MENKVAILNQPLKLACGAQLPNRIAKAAMNEQLGDINNAPTPEIIRLYKRWALGGAGLLITGNVMIDRMALVLPNDIVIEDEQHLSLLEQWATASKTKAGHVWMQINHPGRQSPSYLSSQPVAPSSVPLQLPAQDFADPRALTSAEIEQLIERHIYTATVAKKVGFTGIQIHAAHGYLINQFLSPLSNLRTDCWGGTPEKRMHFLLEVYQGIRNCLGKDFPISVKLNSADFQRGGFTEEESMNVVQALEQVGVDLIEISGGTYEKLAMMGQVQIPQKETTRQREAYFLEYVRRVRSIVSIPIMLTGGFRSVNAMVQAISEGSVDVIGLARPLAVVPDFPIQLLTGRTEKINLQPQLTPNTHMDEGMLEIIWYTQQIHQLAGIREC